METEPGSSPHGAAEPPPQPDARPLTDRLERPRRPLLLDGATGTELERAGVECGLPLWSAHALLDAPQILLQIHQRYVEAGAEILTANTFRTQRRTLARADMGERDGDLTRLAVQLAREAVSLARHAAPRVFVAGSLPPLEDCYRPDLVPEPSQLECEHVRQVALLVEAGVDLILVETMNSLREALTAVRAAAAAGLPVVASFVSWERDRLLSGEPLHEAASRVLEAGALVVGVNCLPPSALTDALAVLEPLGAPLIVSPNLGEPDEQGGFVRSEEIGPNLFVRTLEPWLADEALPTAIVGGCCGTTPAHTQALARRVGTAVAARRSSKK
ncbi:MAG: homocysteine S-methyltransferase family protein [Deltaproteobacteria bacterium]|jgi:S-methylmethionine-dependent homocysteine/selenocysteine methylase|nr:homocysteine S-methyltransferase family protein [Deltaproteobacteria bacterium]